MSVSDEKTKDMSSDDHHRPSPLCSPSPVPPPPQPPPPPSPSPRPASCTVSSSLQCRVLSRIPGRTGPLGQSGASGTLGAHQARKLDLVADSVGEYSDEEGIEEIFGQLWVIPNSEWARVLGLRSRGGGLAWVRSEFLTPADCFPVSRTHRVVGIPKTINFAREIWEGGVRPSYADVVRSSPMAEGGR
jgi:hypothetical protein